MQVRALVAAVTALVVSLAAFPPAVLPPVAAQQTYANHTHADHESASGPDQPAVICGTHLLIEREAEMLRHIPYRTLSEISPSELQTLGMSDTRTFGQLDVEGQTKQFWADNFNTNAKYQVTATLQRVTQHGYVYVDNTRPLSDAALDKIANAWEGIYAKTTALFGDVPDVDGDPHITILLLDIQDEFSISGRGGYIAGYYSSQNQRTTRTSNLREMFYLDTNPAVPDSAGSLQTLAHEFQHMINWNYHKGSGGQDTWLNEGLAEFAAYNAGYGHTSNLGLFLRDTNEDLVDWSYEARDYGTAYLFTLYLWEKYTGDPLVRDLAQHPLLSTDAVDAVLTKHGHGDRFQQVFNKWVVANYLGDSVSAGGIYGYRSLKLVDTLTQGNPENNKTIFRRPTLTNSFTNYPASTNASVHHWAARYYRFTGNAAALNLGFTGRSGTTFGASVIATSADGFAAGSNTIQAFPLADGASGAMAIAGFGATAKSVLVIPSVQQNAPAGASTVTFQLTGGLNDGLTPVTSPTAVATPPAASPTAAATPSAPTPTATAAATTLTPILGSPANDAALTSLGTALTWTLPAGTTQYQLQVVPANGDGPAINLIRNAETSFTIPTPQLGRGDYIMLPGMTYTWRVRATSKASFAPENDPSWGGWASRTFRTATPSAAAMTAVAPANGALLGSLSPVALRWSHPDPSLFYFEIQVSGDTRFDPNPATATSFVWWNLIHGGVTTVQNSWITPALQANATYYWRVRPRVQGDGTPVAWSPTFSFRTSASGTVTATPSATATATLPSGTATPVASATPSGTATPTPVTSATAAPTRTATAVPTVTVTVLPTITVTALPTVTLPPLATATGIPIDNPNE